MTNIVPRLSDSIEALQNQTAGGRVSKDVVRAIQREHGGGAIVAARLEKVVAPFIELEPVRERRQEDDLFPLGTAWGDAYFQYKVDLRPRRVLDAARERWQRLQEILRDRGGLAWLDAWSQHSSDEGHEASLKVYHQRYSLQIEAANADEVLSSWR